MNEINLGELGLLSDFLLKLLIHIPRMGAVFFMLPFLPKGSLSGMIKSAVVAALVLPIIPAHTNPLNIQEFSIFFMLIKESIIGLLIGFAVAIPFWACESIGLLIDNQRGASNASENNPITDSESSPFAIFTTICYGLVFIKLNGLVIITNLVYDSYQLWPINSFIPSLDLQSIKNYLLLFDGILKSGLLLASPILLAMLLSEVSLGLVSMFAPQLQVYFMAMSIKSGVAIFVFIIYLSIFFLFLNNQMMVDPNFIINLLKKTL